jgi:hypothetical protein
MLTINRIYENDCTVGILNFNGFRCFTLELPDLDNQTNISCIPAGRYHYNKIISPSLGECIDICDVIGRTYIRIHAGNYLSEILGCVLVGAGLDGVEVNGRVMITNSGNTLEKLMNSLPQSGELLVK